MLRNKLLIYLLLLVFTTASAYSEKIKYQPLTKSQINELMPSSTRFVESLNGKWQLSFDGKEWENTSLPFSDEQRREMTLKRTLKVDRSVLLGNSWHLYFLGIDDEVEIYINDQFIGKYFSGMTPFMVRIPPKMLTSETNTLVLKILPAESGARQVKEQNLFAKKVYSGAIREILLLGTPHIWVSDLKYKLKFSSGFAKCVVNSVVKISSGEIDRIIGRLSNDSITYDKNKMTVRVEPLIRRKSTGEIVGRGAWKEIDIQKERTVNMNFSLTVLNPLLWSVNSPELYQLSVSITKSSDVIDEFVADIGFREITVGMYEDKPVFAVNGKIFPVKGADYIEDYYHTGQSLSARRMEKDINNLKTLGANLIRVKYGMPDPYFVKLCNKHGLFILTELPVYDVPNNLISSNEIKVRMKNYAEKMINAYGNDPSIFGWGIDEGSQETSKDVRKFEKNMASVFRKYSDNLIYKTTILSSPTVNTSSVDFVLYRLIGMREDINIIKGKLKNLIQQSKSKPAIFNFGLPVQPDNHNGYSDPMSLEAQANYIFNLFYLVKNLDMAGAMVWSYNDYKLNNPILFLNNDDKYICTSGLMDRYRQQRLSYSTLQSLFNNEKDPLFYAGSYTESAPVTFLIYGIVMSLIIILLINRFKRFREYLFRSIMRPYNFYADIRDQRIMSIVQTYVLGMVIAFTIGIFLSSIFYFYRSTEIAQYIYMFLFPVKDIQEYLYSLIWIPELLVAIIAVLFFALIFIISGIIKISSLFVRARIFFSDTYTITIWAGTPILFLLPLALVLNRLLVFSHELMWWVLAFSATIILWVFLRILRSIAVVFDIRPMKVYLSGLILVLLFMVTFVSLYQFELSFISYFQYFFNVLLNV